MWSTRRGTAREGRRPSLCQCQLDSRYIDSNQIASTGTTKDIIRKRRNRDNKTGSGTCYIYSWICDLQFDNQSFEFVLSESYATYLHPEDDGQEQVPRSANGSVATDMVTLHCRAE